MSRTTVVYCQKLKIVCQVADQKILLLQLLYELGHHVIQVSHQPDVCYLEDGSVGVLGSVISSVTRTSHTYICTIANKLVPLSIL